MSEVAEKPPYDRRNCWTCNYASEGATQCSHSGRDSTQWIEETHQPGTLTCPPTAKDCPAWAPRPEAPPSPSVAYTTDAWVGVARTEDPLAPTPLTQPPDWFREAMAPVLTAPPYAPTPPPAPTVFEVPPTGGYRSIALEWDDPAPEGWWVCHESYELPSGTTGYRRVAVAPTAEGALARGAVNARTWPPDVFVPREAERYPHPPVTPGGRVPPFRPDDAGFVECMACAIQPGAPILCQSCLANRTALHRAQREARELAEVMTERQTTVKGLEEDRDEARAELARASEERDIAQKEAMEAQEERDAAEEGLARGREELARVRKALEGARADYAGLLAELRRHGSLEADLARCRAGAEELRASIRRQGEELDRVHVALADALRLVHQLTAPGPLRRIARRLVSLVTP